MWTKTWQKTSHMSKCFPCSVIKKNTNFAVRHWQSLKTEEYELASFSYLKIHEFLGTWTGKTGPNKCILKLMIPQSSFHKTNCPVWIPRTYIFQEPDQYGLDKGGTSYWNPEMCLLQQHRGNGTSGYISLHSIW